MSYEAQYGAKSEAMYIFGNDSSKGLPSGPQSSMQAQPPVQVQVGVTSNTRIEIISLPIHRAGSYE
jgi:hypothetical protein